MLWGLGAVRHPVVSAALVMKKIPELSQAIAGGVYHGSAGHPCCDIRAQGRLRERRQAARHVERAGRQPARGGSRAVRPAIAGGVPWRRTHAGRPLAQQGKS